MIQPEDFVAHLKARDYPHFTGVPCSYFKDIINYIGAHSDAYYAAPNEGSALALACGAYLGGKNTVVMIQNSGLGNLINPLTSLSMIYNIPVLLFISGRAYGVPDEPQHEIIGAKMSGLLQSLGVAFSDLPQDSSFSKAIDQAIQHMKETHQPYVFFVKKDTFGKYISQKKKTSAGSNYPLKRIDAVKIIASLTHQDDLVFATTGMISRELFASHDRAGNFYMQGSMGHIASVALGAAIAKPESRVLVLDGDGAFLMHMGTSSMLGFYKPQNFIHVVLDNESYETTGDQDTTSKTTDFCAIAKACAYTATAEAKTESEIHQAWDSLKSVQGPVLLRVKINRIETGDIPRITTRYKAPEITEFFLRKNLHGTQPKSNNKKTEA